jgi:hypothetical protein
VTRSILLNHHLGRFNDRSDGIAFLELKFVGTPPRDGALNQVFSHSHHNMSHHIAQLNFFDFPAEFVSS